MELPFTLSAPALQKAIASVLLLVLVLVARAFLGRILTRYVKHTEPRRRWLVSIRNALLLLGFIALGIIWVDELKNLGVAILGVGVAFVIAVKEFLLCLNGSFLRATTNAFSVGDRIEWAGHRGDVIDLDLFTTTLLEVGPGHAFHLRTGRTVVIPNSKMLDSPVINESHMKRFVLHVFSVPLGIEEDWQRAETILLKACLEECAPYRDEAARHMKKLEEEHGLTGLPPEPRVMLQLSEVRKLTLLVRFPCPVGRQGSLEQAIMRRFLAEMVWRQLPALDEAAAEREQFGPTTRRPRT
ncbi:MAG: mechanosensitive ion channel [Acidobacteria bacterium]|nr:mechanosensitive ion channel [Acidobacteriota bacterium]